MAAKDFTGMLFSYKTLVHAVAGSTGSVVAMTAFYPLDTVRSRLQLDEREAKNTLAMLKELVKEEGFETLYRGILPVLKSLWTSNFVYFYTFHGLKLLNRSKESQSAGKDLLLATVAGITNVLMTTPLWVVNTRLKMSGLKNHEKVNYKGLIDGLKKIRQQEGILALWNGTIPSLILVSNPAIQFMIYEAVKRRLDQLYPDQKFGALAYFLVGAFSKAVATILTYPIQLLQIKLRHGHTYPDLPQDVGMKELTSYILKKHGFNGLYKGMEAKILQTIFTAALMFATYEKIAAFVFRLMRSR